MSSKVLFLFLLLGICLSFRPAYAQVWLRKLAEEKKATRSEMNFYAIQKAFQAWEDTATETEGGWAQFKRWEFFMEPRVYPSGDLNLPSIYEQIRSLEKLTSLPAGWKSLGPFTVPSSIFSQEKAGAGRINTIAFHPFNANIMWVGAPSGGIWKTTDAGATWSTVTDDLASIGISDITINPLNPDVLYAVTGDGDAGDTYSIGIIKSTNGGATWKPTDVTLQLSDRVYFRKIIIDPIDTATLVATSNQGIYRTEDGFKTAYIVKQGNFKDLEIKPGQKNTFYATSFDINGNAEIYKSGDNGKTFGVLTNGLNFFGKVNRIELAVTKANPEIVYAVASAASDDGFYGLYKSTNSGLSWTTVYDKNDPINLLGWELNGRDSGGQGWYDLSMAVSPIDENILLVGGINIWKSTDGGRTFNISAHWIGSRNVPYVHADHHILRFNPSNRRVYSGNDGGIYYSRDNGDSWADLSDGLTILQIYRTAATDQVSDLFLTGNQDNGSMMLSNSIWKQVTGGDGMECAINQNNKNVLYTSYYNGSFYKSIDGGINFNPIGPADQPGSGAWITPFALGSQDQSSVFAAYSDLFQSPDAGSSWFTLSDNISQGTNLRSMAVAPSDPSIIYAATYTDLYVSRNHGVSWENISAGLPQQAIMSIEVSPNNPEKLWVAFSGFSAGEKVYRSENGGRSWVNYSDGLPNLPCNVIKYKLRSSDGLYLGADVGVYYRNNTMSSWRIFNTGLPNVIINDLDFQYSTNRVIAGSFGRGLWISSMYSPQNKMYAYIYAKSRYTCLNDPTEFSVETPEPPDSIVWNFNDEQRTTSTGNQPVQVTFKTAGVKNISARIYHGGELYTAELNNYVTITESPDLKVMSYGAATYHKGDKATLIAYGADSYSWSPASSLFTPASATTLASPTVTTTYKVTASLGSCSAEDSLTIQVQPGPVNDDVCSALALHPGMNGPFTNVGASVQLNEPLPDTTNCNTQYTWCPEGGLQNTVWFSFKAVSSASSFVTSGFDTQIALYSADACEALLNNNYTLIAANDDYFGASNKYAAAINEAPLEPGVRYWIQIDGSGGGEQGTFYINVYDEPVGTDHVIPPDHKVKVFPNPSEGEFDLEINHITGKVIIRIMNMTGKILREKKTTMNGSAIEHFRVDHPGIYMIGIIGEKEQLWEKVVVK